MMATVIRIEFICDNLLRSCRRAEQLGQSNQVVGGHCQRELEPHTRNTTEHGPGETPNGLSPAERLFNPLTLLLADLIAWMPRGTRIDRRASVGRVLRDVRRHVEIAQIVDELAGIVRLVSAERDALLSRRIAH